MKSSLRKLLRDAAELTAPELTACADSEDTVVDALMCVGACSASHAHTHTHTHTPGVVPSCRGASFVLDLLMATQ